MLKALEYVIELRYPQDVMKLEEKSSLTSKVVRNVR